MDGEIVDELKNEQSISLLFKNMITVNMVTTFVYFTNKTNSQSWFESK
jgi:hypothetical protein